MAQVRLTVLESNCRGGVHFAGEEFLVGDVCPPVCHELWQCIYPMVYVLINGGDLDYGPSRARRFEFRCPDGGRVVIRGEAMD